MLNVSCKAAFANVFDLQLFKYCGPLIEPLVDCLSFSSVVARFLTLAQSKLFCFFFLLPTPPVACTRLGLAQQGFHYPFIPLLTPSFFFFGFGINRFFCGFIDVKCPEAVGLRPPFVVPCLKLLNSCGLCRSPQGQSPSNLPPSSPQSSACATPSNPNPRKQPPIFSQQKGLVSISTPFPPSYLHPVYPKVYEPLLPVSPNFSQ